MLPEEQEAEPRLAPGSHLAGFRIVRVVGRGGFGTVYEAFDDLLGRRVAIKVLLSSNQGGHPSLIEEARMTAALDHPNIVTVYSVSSPDAPVPFIAMEFLSAEDLRSTIERSPLSISETTRIAEGIALALAHAHARGIIHGDLKPANIVLPNDGRLRVLDFGLARTVDTVKLRDAEDWPGGTPLYAPPELWSGEAWTPAGDIYSMGVILYELLEGRVPRTLAETYALTDPHETPPPLRWSIESASETRAHTELIETCLAPDPALRPSAQTFLRALGGLQGSTHLPSTPFPGLRSFERQDRAVFFGRDMDLQRAQSVVRRSALTAVIGPSGIGKSSFLEAGLMPRLEAEDDFELIAARVGQGGLSAVAAALPEFTRAGANDDAARLVVALERRTLATGRKCLLLFDQLEEIWTLHPDGALARRVVPMLQRLAENAGDRVRLVVGLREDFVTRLPSETQIFVLPGLDAMRIEQALVQPLNHLGFSPEAPDRTRLLSALLEKQPTPLPVLQVLAIEAWARRSAGSRTVPFPHPEPAAISDALSRHADRVLEGLTPVQRRHARTLLTALVTPEGSRRGVKLETLVERIGEDARSLAQHCVDARILVAHAGETSAGTWLELVHESLITGWQRLQDWLREDQDQIAAFTELEQASELWDHHGRSHLHLWTEEELERSLAHTAPNSIAQDTLIGHFVGACRDEHTREKRRRQRLQWSVLATLSLLAAASMAVAAEFYRREQLAREQARQINLANADIGIVEFEVTEDGPDGTHSVSPDRVRLLRSDRGQPAEALIPVRRSLLASSGAPRIRLEVRSGPAFIEVDRRPCASSRLPIVALPGYRLRTHGLTRMKVRVPSCQAVLEGSHAIPSGHHCIDEACQLRKYLSGFRMDRTEASNAQYQAFAQLSAITGIEKPPYPVLAAMPDISRDNHPVVAVSLAEARAYCAFRGGRLPTREQWHAAARAGDPTNPSRRYPWGDDFDQTKLNVGGDEDGFLGSAPVEAFPAGATALGLLNMSGNVSEWTETASTGSTHVIKGGSWAYEHETGLDRIDIDNVRDPRTIVFSVGIRCIY